jgi:hypothetical protein
MELIWIDCQPLWILKNYKHNFRKMKRGALSNSKQTSRAIIADRKTYIFRPENSRAKITNRNFQDCGPQKWH